MVTPKTVPGLGRFGWIGPRANLARPWAARMEGAPGRWIERAWELGPGREVGKVRARDRGKDGVKERGRVGVARRGENFVGATIFDDPAEIHDRDSVGEMIDDREIVADQDHRETEFAPQPVKEVQDLRLDGDVGRRSRLVADQDAGLPDQRAGDGNPLALTAAAGACAGP